MLYIPRNVTHTMQLSPVSSPRVGGYFFNESCTISERLLGRSFFLPLKGVVSSLLKFVQRFYRGLGYPREDLKNSLHRYKEGHTMKRSLVEVSVVCSGSNTCTVFVYASIDRKFPVELVFAVLAKHALGREILILSLALRRGENKGEVSTAVILKTNAYCRTQTTGSSKQKT